jgi:hypothetical protein
MGYPDELIRRLKDGGAWQKMTGEQQAECENYSDEKARELMVTYDHVDMGDPETLGKMGHAALYNLCGLFGGALFDLEDDKTLLSEAGQLLAGFVEALEARGLARGDISAGLEGLDIFTLTALMTIWQGPRSGRQD